MTIGPAELIMLALVVFFLVVTVYGVYRAFTSGDVGWGVGILVAWFVGLGWLLAIIYLVAVDRRRRMA